MPSISLFNQRQERDIVREEAALLKWILMVGRSKKNKTQWGMLRQECEQLWEVPEGMRHSRWSLIWVWFETYRVFVKDSIYREFLNMCYWFFPHTCLNSFIYLTVCLSLHFICRKSKVYVILWIFLLFVYFYLFSSLYLKNLYDFYLYRHFIIIFSYNIPYPFHISRIPILLLYTSPAQALLLAFSSPLTPLILFIALIAFSAFLVACIIPNHIQVLTWPFITI